MVRKVVPFFLLTSLICSAQNSSFIDPPVFTSSNHLLDVLIVAQPEQIALGSQQPTAWVYQICKSSSATQDQCPADSQTVSPYGGVRFQLTQGDHLRMRLVNHLPPAPADAQYAHGSNEMMDEMLAANPTNIHTHGLIVEPRKADAGNPTYGDYVYVYGYPAGKMPAMLDPDLTATDQPIQYDIYIPLNHPSGFFYFHPHIHGLGVNQISEGMEGLITIGSVTDYASSTAGEFSTPLNYTVRYLALKDMQVLPSGEVQDQEDSQFCAPTSKTPRYGSCPGINDGNNPNDPGGLNYTGGNWFFSVNGAVYPSMDFNESTGELWRILNGAASRSYALAIHNDRTGAPVTFQVVSLDGVALAPPVGTDVSTMSASVGGKFRAVPCPGPRDPKRSAEPVCATELVMFPSSRAEIYLSPKQAAQLKSATLLTQAFDTGTAGDDWPEANLAHITSQGHPGAANNTLDVRPVKSMMLSPTGILGGPSVALFPGMTKAIPVEDAQTIAAGQRTKLPVALDAASAQEVQSLSLQQIQAFGPRLKALEKPVASLASPNCSALPAGHHRRIFFGIPSNNPDGFGLGYEEVDADGNPVPGTFEDITPFNPAYVNVCLPLGGHNMPVTEEWELVNVAGEAHNFHIHQTRFTVLPNGAPAGDGGALMDNVALPSGSSACDGSIATWRSGACVAHPVYVSIPFSQIGDFVYHCHIGEHQDGGMMAHIRVIANP